MGNMTAIGYLIMAARKAGLNDRAEEKLVEAMREVMKDQLPSDALELYTEWAKYDAEQEYQAEMEEAAGETIKGVA